MEVLPRRSSRWGGRGRTTAWKFYLKGGAVGKEEDEEPYGMEVLPQRRSRSVRKKTKNPTAWKSYHKGGSGE
jgi:hypothetical protein